MSASVVLTDADILHVWACDYADWRLEHLQKRAGRKGKSQLTKIEQELYLAWMEGFKAGVNREFHGVRYP